MDPDTQANGSCGRDVHGELRFEVGENCSPAHRRVRSEDADRPYPARGPRRDSARRSQVTPPCSGCRLLELRLLGSLDLRDPSGAEIRPVLQQPKRLALLAYLALTPSGGFRRRDSLVGLFWPDLDGEHARGALRRSLYFLRRACGDDVIVSRGEDDVGIRPDAIWVDVAAFEAALAAGRNVEALELYGGDLLEGFYVAGAPAMEHWLDMERTRLRGERGEGGVGRGRRRWVERCGSHMGPEGGRSRAG